MRKCEEMEIQVINGHIPYSQYVLLDEHFSRLVAVPVVAVTCAIATGQRTQPFSLSLELIKQKLDLYKEYKNQVTVNRVKSTAINVRSET